MGRFFALVLMSLTAAAATAQGARDCSHARSQVEASDCAAAGWAESDAELNRLWSIVKPAADARGRGKALLAAQRAWLTYRDATCTLESDRFQGGSIAPQVHAACLDRLTRQRNADLREMLP